MRHFFFNKKYKLYFIGIEVYILNVINICMYSVRENSLLSYLYH